MARARNAKGVRRDRPTQRRSLGPPTVHARADAPRVSTPPGNDSSRLNKRTEHHSATGTQDAKRRVRHPEVGAYVLGVHFMIVFILASFVALRLVGLASQFSPSGRFQLGIVTAVALGSVTTIAMGVH